MKRVIPIIIVIVLLIAGYFGIRALRAQQQADSVSDLQTVIASRGSLTSTIGATGLVRPNQTAVLLWESSGNVGEVSIILGEQVERGQVLARLEQTSLPQNIILAESDLINAQNALDDLLNSQLASAQALQNVYNAQKIVIEAERAMDIFDEKEYKDDLDAARDDVVNKEDDLETAREDFEPYQDWDEDNDKRKEFEQKLDDAQNAYDEAVRVLDLLELDKKLAQANLIAAQAALADAQREHERVKDGPDPDDVAILEARIAAAQATIQQAYIDAPFAGTITDLSLKVGDRVGPGSTAFRLDDLSRLLVEVMVSEVDINRVQAGQDVNLTFDAILSKEYSGIVTEVAPVGQITQGVVEFSVTVELMNADEDVKPGMTAAVNIVVEQLENVLLVPNRAVRVVDGQRVVYILQNNELELVKITLGASSDTESEVVDGTLRVGDMIVLNPPQVFDTNGPPPFVRR
ncbi:MAG: efflux RND transporter periplasmic adaptor subunit [Anaerolineales bacterium]|nr:efflux RND transporter periplasmic adaptor subunit [Anaerolineales bacterium]